MSSSASLTPLRVNHPIAPVYDSRSEVLILGSFPSPKSREQGFFYGHPQNRMWKVLAQILNEPEPTTVERRRDFLLRHHIAMWDVLASCEIEGASDASITNEVPNDLEPILAAAPIKAIYCAGATAATLYVKHIEPVIERPCIRMPSTSPANAAWSLDRLVDAWSEIRQRLTEDPFPILDVADVITLERTIADAGTSLAELMDRAGTWLAHHVHVHDPHAAVAILAGNGNNGGDGWVAARMLATWGHHVTLVSAKPADDIEAQPAHDAACAAMSEFAHLPVNVAIAPTEEDLAETLKSAAVIVDAILGTGFAYDEVRSPFDTWIGLANQAREQGAYIVAADCPSGLNAQTGTAAHPHITADETVTMITSKTGLHTAQGQASCGHLRVAQLCDLAPFRAPSS